MLLQHAEEERVVTACELLRRAVANGVANALRGKGKKEAPMFRKRRKAKRAQSAETGRERMERIQAMLDGKGAEDA